MFCEPPFHGYTASIAKHTRREMMTTAIRPAAVAGMFYPAGAAALAALVDDLLAHTPEPEPLPRPPRALVVPHAGLVY
ncbi:MAG: AmmeMemoRadiSam system protein B, partial [Pseudomonadota bacterium]|nr:AmmeMemoRadiSam system protein B [Pseudomonadota bacterium]